MKGETPLGSARPEPPRADDCPAHRLNKGITMRIRTILAAAAAPAALAAVLLGTAGQASAATGPQQFVTHVNQHPDTTSYPGAPAANDVSLPYPGYGSVWAFDNDTVQMTPVQVTPGPDNGYANWQVFFSTTGSF